MNRLPRHASDSQSQANTLPTTSYKTNDHVVNTPSTLPSNRPPVNAYDETDTRFNNCDFNDQEGSRNFRWPSFEGPALAYNSRATALSTSSGELPMPGVPGSKVGRRVAEIEAPRIRTSKRTREPPMSSYHQQHSWKGIDNTRGRSLDKEEIEDTESDHSYPGTIIDPGGIKDSLIRKTDIEEVSATINAEMMKSKEPITFEESKIYTKTDEGDDGTAINVDYNIMSTTDIGDDYKNDNSDENDDDPRQMADVGSSSSAGDTKPTTHTAPIPSMPINVLIGNRVIDDSEMDTMTTPSDSSPSHARRLYEPRRVQPHLNPYHLNARKYTDRHNGARQSVQYTSGEEGLMRSLNDLLGDIGIDDEESLYADDADDTLRSISKTAPKDVATDECFKSNGDGDSNNGDDTDLAKDCKDDDDIRANMDSRNEATQITPSNQYDEVVDVEVLVDVVADVSSDKENNKSSITSSDTLHQQSNVSDKQVVDKLEEMEVAIKVGDKSELKDTYGSVIDDYEYMGNVRRRDSAASESSCATSNINPSSPRSRLNTNIQSMNIDRSPDTPMPGSPSENHDHDEKRRTLSEEFGFLSPGVTSTENGYPQYDPSVGCLQGDTSASDSSVNTPSRIGLNDVGVPPIDDASADMTVNLDFEFTGNEFDGKASMRSTSSMDSSLYDPPIEDIPLNTSRGVPISGLRNSDVPKDESHIDEPHSSEEITNNEHINVAKSSSPINTECKMLDSVDASVENKSRNQVENVVIKSFSNDDVINGGELVTLDIPIVDNDKTIKKQSSKNDSQDKEELISYEKKESVQESVIFKSSEDGLNNGIHHNNDFDGREDLPMYENLLESINNKEYENKETTIIQTTIYEGQPTIAPGKNSIDCNGKHDMDFDLAQPVTKPTIPTSCNAVSDNIPGNITEISSNSHPATVPNTNDAVIGLVQSETRRLRMCSGVINVRSKPHVVAMSESDSVFAYSSAGSPGFNPVNFNISTNSSRTASRTGFRTLSHSISLSFSATDLPIDTRPRGYSSIQDISRSASLHALQSNPSKSPTDSQINKQTSLHGHENHTAFHFNNIKIEDSTPINRIQKYPIQTIPKFSKCIVEKSETSSKIDNFMNSQVKPSISPIQIIPEFSNKNMEKNRVYSNHNTNSDELIHNSTLNFEHTPVNHESEYPKEDFVQQAEISQIQEIPSFSDRNKQNNYDYIVQNDVNESEIPNVSSIQTIPLFLKNEYSNPIKNENTLTPSENINKLPNKSTFENVSQNKQEEIKIEIIAPVQPIPPFKENPTETNSNAFDDKQINSKYNINEFGVSDIQVIPPFVKNCEKKLETKTEQEMVKPQPRLNTSQNAIDETHKKLSPLQIIPPFSEKDLPLCHEITSFKVKDKINHRNEHNTVISPLKRIPPFYNCTKNSNNNVLNEEPSIDIGNGSCDNVSVEEQAIIPLVQSRNSSRLVKHLGQQLSDSRVNEGNNDHMVNDNPSTPIDDINNIEHYAIEKDIVRVNDTMPNSTIIKGIVKSTSPSLNRTRSCKLLGKSISFEDKITNIDDNAHIKSSLKRSITLPKPNLKLYIPSKNRTENEEIKSSSSHKKRKTQTPYPREDNKQNTFERSSNLPPSPVPSKQRSKRIQTPYPREHNSFEYPVTTEINLSDIYNVQPMRKVSFGESSNSTSNELTIERVSICTSPYLESVAELSNECDTAEYNAPECAVSLKNTILYKPMDDLQIRLNEEIRNKIRKLSSSSNKVKINDTSNRGNKVHKEHREHISISHILPTIRKHGKKNPIHRTTICSRQPKKRKENIFKRRNTMIAFDTESVKSIIKKSSMREKNKPAISKKRVADIVETLNKPQHESTTNNEIKRQRSIIKTNEINKRIKALELRNKPHEPMEPTQHKEVKFTEDSSYLKVSTADALKTITDEFDFGSFTEDSVEETEIVEPPPSMRKIGKLLKSKSFISSKPLFVKKNMTSLRAAKERSVKIKPLDDKPHGLFGIFSNKNSKKSLKREKSLIKMKRKMSIGDLLKAKANLKTTTTINTTFNTRKPGGAHISTITKNESDNDKKHNKKSANDKQSMESTIKHSKHKNKETKLKEGVSII